MYSAQVANFFSGLCSEKKIQESRTFNKTGHVFSKVREMFLKMIDFNKLLLFTLNYTGAVSFSAGLVHYLLKNNLLLFAGSTLDVITRNTLTL